MCDQVLKELVDKFSKEECDYINGFELKGNMQLIHDDIYYLIAFIQVGVDRERCHEYDRFLEVKKRHHRECY